MKVAVSSFYLCVLLVIPTACGNSSFPENINKNAASANITLNQETRSFCAALSEKNITEAGIAKPHIVAADEINNSVFIEECQYSEEAPICYYFNLDRLDQLIARKYFRYAFLKPYMNASTILAIILSQQECGTANLAHLLNTGDTKVLPDLLKKAEFGFDLGLDHHTNIGVFGIINFKLSWSDQLTYHTIASLKKHGATCQEDIPVEKHESECRIWMFQRINLAEFLDFMKNLTDAELPAAIWDTGD